MLYSMTGYGKAQNKNQQLTITIEIKSLNSKTLDINLKMPTWLKTYELDVRQFIQDNLYRGKIDIYIVTELSEGLVLKHFHSNTIKNYYLQLQQLLQELNIDNSNPYITATLFREALNTPDAYESNEDELNTEENKQLLFLTLEQSCQQVNQFRQQEGSKLEKDILYQIQLLEEYQKQIQKIEPERKIKMREKILSNLKNYLNESKINNERFEQEMIYYLEKLDINEELVRLSSHLEYFKSICNEGYNKGKKLSFVTQEIGREINTIGSKANDDSIQKIVVEMKDVLEKIKEQLNNIL